MNGFPTISRIFDDAVFNLLGSSLDEFLDIPTNMRYLQKSFTDERGRTAKIIQRKGPKGETLIENYVNGEKVKELPEWARIGLDKQTNKIVFPAIFEPWGCNNKLPESIVSGTEIPHTNVVVDKEGNLFLQFALAGVDEDRIEISAEDSYLWVKVDPIECDEDDGPWSVYLQKGIKNSDGLLWKKILVDQGKYDIKRLEYEYENGMLTIRIPKTEVVDSNKTFFKKSNVNKEMTEFERKEEEKEIVREMKDSLKREEVSNEERVNQIVHGDFTSEDKSIDEALNEIPDPENDEFPTQEEVHSAPCSEAPTHQVSSYEKPKRVLKIK